MQCKDIPDQPILDFIAKVQRRETFSDIQGTRYIHVWATMFGPEFGNSIFHGMPANTPDKLALAKMKTLIRRKLVTGCTCGCRGDFELTEAGRQIISR